MGDNMLSDLRFLTYDRDGSPRAGVLRDGHVHDLAELGAVGGVPLPQSLLAALELGDALESALARAFAASPVGRPLAQVTLLTPLQYPGALYCAGANYSDHMLEMTGEPAPPPEGRDPYFFLKSPRATLIGPNEPIRLPRWSHKVDWEAEVALVVGREARDVTLEEAMDHVFGFTILHDVSARDRADRGGDLPAFRWDWLSSKCFPTSAPCGPWITPRAAITDPDDLAIRLWVNNRLEQDSNTSRLVHGYADMIAFLSRTTVLYPGDVIATGTPAGVGLPKNRFLQPGDVVRIEVEGLGALVNPVAAA